MAFLPFEKFEIRSSLLSHDAIKAVERRIKPVDLGGAALVGLFWAVCLCALAFFRVEVRKATGFLQECFAAGDASDFPELGDAELRRRRSN